MCEYTVLSSLCKFFCSQFVSCFMHTSIALSLRKAAELTFIMYCWFTPYHKVRAHCNGVSQGVLMYRPVMGVVSEYGAEREQT